MTPSTRWWICPLRSCSHGLILHDGDGRSEEFVCCSDGCECRGWLESEVSR